VLVGKLYSQDNQEGISIFYLGDFQDGKFGGKGRSVNIAHVDLSQEERKVLPRNVFQWTGKEKLLKLGTVYEGSWENGKMHGKGRLYDPKTGSVYEGDFVEVRVIAEIVPCFSYCHSSPFCRVFGQDGRKKYQKDNITFTLENLKMGLITGKASSDQRQAISLRGRSKMV